MITTRQRDADGVLRVRVNPIVSPEAVGLLLGKAQCIGYTQGGPSLQDAQASCLQVQILVGRRSRGQKGGQPSSKDE